MAIIRQIVQSHDSSCFRSRAAWANMSWVGSSFFMQFTWKIPSHKQKREIYSGRQATFHVNFRNKCLQMIVYLSATLFGPRE